MSKIRKLVLVLSAILGPLLILGLIILYPSWISRTPYPAPEPAYQNWEEILSNPQAISIGTYSTGIMETNLSGIMNLDHKRAAGLEDLVIQIPVNAFILQHHELGAHLIDAGLDSSYVSSPYGTLKGVRVKNFLGRGSQESGTHIAAILEKENIALRGVWLTHLHPDHVAGIVDLPKNIPYTAGKGERYVNFSLIMRGDHLAGIDQLLEFDFSAGIDLPPLGKAIDVFGDGSFWAISSSGHSKGHVIYFINGVDAQVLVLGDASNTLDQFQSGIGPGYFSSDLEEGQEVIDQISAFKDTYPEVILSFGHDLRSW